jgi:hypothetical protein
MYSPSLPCILRFLPISLSSTWILLIIFAEEYKLWSSLSNLFQAYYFTPLRSKYSPLVFT